MEHRKLLLPIDVNKCRPAVFDVVNRFARKFQLTATLFHVVTLNVKVSENRIYEELTAETQYFLRRLSAKYISPDILVSHQVRIGKAAEQILRLAIAERSDVILMTVDGAALRGTPLVRKPGPSTATTSRIVNSVLKAAPCDVLVLPFTGELDCERAFGCAQSNEVPTDSDSSNERVRHQAPARAGGARRDWLVSIDHSMLKMY